MKFPVKPSMPQLISDSSKSQAHSVICKETVEVEHKVTNVIDFQGQKMQKEDIFSFLFPHSRRSYLSHDSCYRKSLINDKKQNTRSE